MRHRYHSIIRSNPLKGDLTQCWTQPPSSNIGLWIIGDLWSVKMHLESLYVTCLCVTPVSRSTGLIYKLEEKERHVATNAWHAANGIEWPGGRPEGLLSNEELILPMAVPRYKDTPTPPPCLSYPAPWQSLGRSFLWNGGAHSANCADRSPVDNHAAPRHCWPPPWGLFFSFCLWSPKAGSALHCFSSSQCGCGNSTFAFPFSSGWEPGRCFFTSTFSIGTEVLSPCNHIFQGPTAACGTQRRKREQIKKYPKKQICEQPNQ